MCFVVFLRVPSTMSTQAPTFTQPLQSGVALEGSAATFEAQVSGKEIFYVPFKLYLIDIADCPNIDINMLNH